MRSRAQGLSMAMRICVSIFFIVLGLEGFLFHNSDVGIIARKLVAVFGGEASIYVILISILEIVCGAVLFASILSPVGSRFLWGTMGVSTILWLTVVILKDIIGTSVFSNFNIGAFTQWLRMLVMDVVLLIAMWTIKD